MFCHFHPQHTYVLRKKTQRNTPVFREWASLVVGLQWDFYFQPFLFVLRFS